MRPIFHITSRREAAAAAMAGEYIPAGFEAEGFVHCSYAHQLTRVADFLFRGRTDLALLEIDPGLLGCKVIDENLDGGAELFPHIYGKVPMSAVVRVLNFPCRGDGRFALPGEVMV